MNVSLNNPLAILDIEATGLNVTSDRIVEIAILKVDGEGNEKTFVKRLNPEMEIPKEVIEIHGITNEDVKDAPTFKEILPELEAFISDADFAGYNSNKFDLPILAEEMLRAGSTMNLSSKQHIDVQNIFHKMEQRTLIAALAFYCQKELTDAHSAMGDVRATWEVLNAQIDKYSDLENNVAFLSKFSRHGEVERIDFAGRLAVNKNGEAIYNFGKHKGKTIKEVSHSEPGYYGWMMDADFPLHTKISLRREMEKIKKERVQSRAEKKQSEQQTFESKLEQLKNKFK